MIDIENLKETIRNSSNSSKIYIGVDSEKIKKDEKSYADFSLTVVIHKNGNNGGKVFGKIIREMDYDKKDNKPSFRLMREVYYAASLYTELYDSFGDREVEIHLDLNKNEKFNSNAVFNQAIGYIKGACNITPKTKPDAWAASSCADRLKDIIYVNGKESIVFC